MSSRSDHWARHAFWIALGAFAALGVLTGVGGNGALVLLAVVVGAALALWRGGGHGVLGFIPGFLLGIAGLALLAPVWIPPCPPGAVACSISPAYDVVPTVVGSASLGVALLGVTLLLEWRRTPQGR